MLKGYIPEEFWGIVYVRLIQSGWKMPAWFLETLDDDEREELHYATYATIVTTLERLPHSEALRFFTSQYDGLKCFDLWFSDSEWRHEWLQAKSIMEGSIH